MRALCLLSVAVVLSAVVGPPAAHAQVPLPRVAPLPVRVAPPQTASVRVAPQTSAVEPTPIAAPSTPAQPGGLLAAVTLADIGFSNGVRFANLGGHHDLFVPLPQDGDVAASELILDLDDVSAHDARRNLEVQVNDRTVIALVLDGKSRGRIIHVPLGQTKPTSSSRSSIPAPPRSIAASTCAMSATASPSGRIRPSRSISARSRNSMSPPPPR
jgi:hypothetical protein